VEVTLDVPHGRPEPPDLLLDLGPRDDAMRDFRQRGLHRYRRTDGDAGRHADAAQGAIAHSVRSISLKPAATRAQSASTAASASSPFAAMTRVAPNPAARIIPPLMLFPFTVTSPRRTSMADLNRPAVFTNSAAGRAWTPRGLTIRASRSITAIESPPPGRSRRV